MGKKSDDKKALGTNGLIVIFINTIEKNSVQLYRKVLFLFRDTTLLSGIM